jgi:hypothetical protein
MVSGGVVLSAVPVDFSVDQQRGGHDEGVGGL